MSEPRQGWLQRLGAGLSRTTRQMSEQVAQVFTGRPLDQAQLDELEEMLIEADLGPAAAARIAKAFGEQRFGKGSVYQCTQAGNTAASGAGPSETVDEKSHDIVDGSARWRYVCCVSAAARSI